MEGNLCNYTHPLLLSSGVSYVNRPWAFVHADNAYQLCGASYVAFASSSLLVEA